MPTAGPSSLKRPASQETEDVCRDLKRSKREQLQKERKKRRKKKRKPSVVLPDDGDQPADKGKGKGRATDSPRPDKPSRAEDELTTLIVASTSDEPSTSAQAEAQAAEIARLRAQLSEQTSLVQRHETHLSSVQNSLTCQICLDLLYRPFTLAPCGHIACYTCLLRWFTTNPNTSGGANDPVFDPDAIVNGSLPALAPAPAPPPRINTALRGRHHRRHHHHRRPPTPQYLHKCKTCPLCRAVVRDRPTEVYTVKDMVGGLTRSQLVELPAPPPPPPPANPKTTTNNTDVHPGNPNNDPWNNVFAPVRRPAGGGGIHGDGSHFHFDYFMAPGGAYLGAEREANALAAAYRGAIYAAAGGRGRRPRAGVVAAGTGGGAAAAAQVPGAEATAAIAAGAGAEGNPADPNDMGFHDIEDGGVYRCWDCMHEIWGRLCSSCGREYTGHQAAEDDEDEDDDYFGDATDFLDDAEFDLDHNHGFDDFDPYGDVEEDEEEEGMFPVRFAPLNRQEEVEWPAGRRARGGGGVDVRGRVMVPYGHILNALADMDGPARELSEDEDGDLDFLDQYDDEDERQERRRYRGHHFGFDQGEDNSDIDSEIEQMIFEESMAAQAERMSNFEPRIEAAVAANGVMPRHPIRVASSDEEEEGGRANGARRRAAAHDRARVHALVGGTWRRRRRNGSDDGGEMQDVWEGSLGVEAGSEEEDEESEIPRRGTRQRLRPRPVRRRRREVVEFGSDSEYEGSFIDDDGEEVCSTRVEPSVIVVDEQEGSGGDSDDGEDEDDGGIAATFALLNEARVRERRSQPQPRPPPVILTSDHRRARAAVASSSSRSTAADNASVPTVVVSSDEGDEDAEFVRLPSGSRPRPGRRRGPVLHDEEEEEEEDITPPSIVDITAESELGPIVPSPPFDEDEGGGAEEQEKECIDLRRTRMARAAETRRQKGE